MIWVFFLDFDNLLKNFPRATWTWKKKPIILDRSETYKDGPKAIFSWNEDIDKATYEVKSCQYGWSLI